MKDVKERKLSLPPCWGHLEMNIWKRSGYLKKNQSQRSCESKSGETRSNGPGENCTLMIDFLHHLNIEISKTRFFNSNAQVRFESISFSTSEQALNYHQGFNEHPIVYAGLISVQVLLRTYAHTTVSACEHWPWMWTSLTRAQTWLIDSLPIGLALSKANYKHPKPNSISESSLPPVLVYWHHKHYLKVNGIILWLADAKGRLKSV